VQRCLYVQQRDSVAAGRVDSATELKFLLRFPVAMRLTPKLPTITPGALPVAVADGVDQPTAGQTHSASSRSPFGADFSILSAAPHGVDLAAQVQLHIDTPVVWSTFTLSRVVFSLSLLLFCTVHLHSVSFRTRSGLYSIRVGFSGTRLLFLCVSIQRASRAFHSHEI
jgi:hypothetical protein